MKVNKMTKEQKDIELGKLKKANQTRKLQMAQKAGYKTIEGYIKALGGIVSNKKTSPKVVKEKPVKKEEPSSEKTDYVIAFDTTGSMSSYIDAVRRHVSSLIPELFSNSSDLMMKIVAFGDYCDMTNVKLMQFGNAFQTTQLTNNQKELINFVKTAKDTNGCDSDEFYELVIKKIVEETPWRENSKRVILLIADANPHKVGYVFGGVTHKIDWKKEARKAAEMAIQIDTINCGHSGHEFRKELSEITNGVNIDFQSSGKTTELIIATTYARSSKLSFTASMNAAMDSGDDELIGMYKKINETL